MSMKLALGTVQFGLNYGISNYTGKPDYATVGKILTLARDVNITAIDSAFGYGDSHQVLIQHKALLKNARVTTKLPPHQDNIYTKECVKRYIDNINDFRQDLKLEFLEAVLLHNADDWRKPGFEILFSQLELLKKAGEIKHIGFSSYANFDIAEPLDSFSFSTIQTSFNAFDQHLAEDRELCAKKKIHIVARSIFLQGLLLMPLNKVPSYFQPWYDKLFQLKCFAQENSLTDVEVALLFAEQNESINQFLVGVNRVEELEEIIQSYERVRALPKLDLPNVASKDEKLINPSLWSRSK